MEYKEPESRGFQTIPVLEFLNGFPWNQMTKNMMPALRPSAVRECWGSMKCDGHLWRVTVWLKGTEAAPVIDYIEQEVVVGLEGGFEHGHHLQTEMEKLGIELE